MKNSFKLLVCLFLLNGLACKNVNAPDKEAKPASETLNISVQSISNPVSGNSSLPRLFSNNEKLYLSWVEKNDSLSSLNYSVYEDGYWNSSETVISGSDWFVNWADFPVIAENNGNILTSFLQKSANGTYTYDVKLNLYNAATKTWKRNFILHDDKTQSEHGFVSIRPYTENSFLIVWLDGRETAGKEHGGGEMTLRAAIVFEDGSIGHDTLLDERVCDCCQTGVAIGPNDEIIVAYRDRSARLPSGTVKDGNVETRDIATVRWQRDSGWSKPQIIGDDHWKIAGCPVNGPSIDAFENAVAVAWFTAAEKIPKVQVAFSQDTGMSFGAPIRVDAGNATGRVAIELISKTEAVVLWMEPKGENEFIQLVKVNSDGSIGKPLTVSQTSSERASGFPQLQSLGSKIYVAFTYLQPDGSSTIETHSLDLSFL